VAKLLRNQDRILLLLGAAVDLFEDLADAGGLASYSYKTVYGWVPPRFKKHNVQMSIKRALKTGYIEKIFKNSQPYLRLTGKGKKKLIRDFSFLMFQKKKWDRKWRLVFFDIKEISRKTRDRLRNKLKEIGFAQFQQSVYISPHDFTEDIREFLENYGLADAVYVLATRELLVGNERSLASKLWKLDKLNREYEKILEFWEDKRKKPSRNKIVREIRSRYFDVLALDPFLPKELLPSDWLRPQVESLIRKISS